MYSMKQSFWKILILTKVMANFIPLGRKINMDQNTEFFVTFVKNAASLWNYFRQYIEYIQ